jgi:hypothetical protein
MGEIPHLGLKNAVFLGSVSCSYLTGPSMTRWEMNYPDKNHVKSTRSAAPISASEGGVRSPAQGQP